jgi:hypothetical protein
MLDSVQHNAAHEMKLWKEAFQYDSTMANISIKDGRSPYEKFVGTPSLITTETCVSFRRIGYVTLWKCIEEQVQTKSNQVF